MKRLLVMFCSATTKARAQSGACDLKEPEQ
jgi:hypothetical protein